MNENEFCDEPSHTEETSAIEEGKPKKKGEKNRSSHSLANTVTVEFGAALAIDKETVETIGVSQVQINCVGKYAVIGTAIDG